MILLLLGALLSILIPAAICKHVLKGQENIDKKPHIKTFLRAAMPEEAVKYFFACRVLKRNQALGMKEAILLVRPIGIGYGFTEKPVYFTLTGRVLCFGFTRHGFR